MKHKHHIIPRHMGGTDDSSNLVELTVEEHAEAHKKLYEEYGRWEDWAAWQGLEKLIPHAEMAREVSRLANLGKPSNYAGHKASPELRKKLSLAKLGKKYGPRKPYRRTEKSLNRPNRGQPWSEARRAAHENRRGVS